MSEERPTDRDAKLVERSRRLVVESIAIRQVLREEQAAADEALKMKAASVATSPHEHQA